MPARIAALDSAGAGCSVALHEPGGELRQVDGTAERPGAEHLLELLEQLLEGPLAGPNAAPGSPGRVDALAFGRGPGAFTSVRCTVALAHGLALAADAPLVPVSSLAALALQACTSTQGRIGLAGGEQGEVVLALTDARLGEVYCGLFHAARGCAPAPLAAELVCKPQAVGDWAAACLDAWLTSSDVAADRLALRCAGNGLRVHAQALDSHALARRLPGTSEAGVAWLDSCADVVADASAVARVAALHLAAGETGVGPEDAQPIYLRERVAEVPARLRREAVL